VTDNIGVLLIEEPFYNIRPSVVREGLASRFHQSIKHRTKLLLHELRNISTMVCDIVLHNPCQHRTKSALIIKAVGRRLKRDEICTCAGLSKVVESREYLLVEFSPVRQVEGVNKLLKQLRAVGVGWGRGGFRQRDVQLLIECAGVNQHLHESGESACSIALTVVGF
jgi:hypothetical protein